MKDIGNPPANPSLKELGIGDYKTAYWNLGKEELVEESINRNMGLLSDTGAICVRTGKFTGRSPLDRFIVEDEITANTVAWGKINKPFRPEKFEDLYQKITRYFKGRDLFVRDAYACSDPKYRMKIRVITELPWSNQFAYNMFIRPSDDELKKFEPDWTVICAPGFKADPGVDETRQDNFAILNFKRKAIIIGGTGYTGEIKKGIFSALNFILPHDRDVLSMHCSANIGKSGDTAVFFGLSGTGKTTLSADPDRQLIGDDEHGWSDEGVFNFEGGCYAKTIDLTEEKEPQIYHAIRHGAILENITFLPGTRIPDYSDSSITQNTRVSYPIHYIENFQAGSRGGHPENIFFLTCDAFGVLPPISKLSAGQAMYHFISGYTAKVAGTEEGIDDPVKTFSACFGSPFLPLHPAKYAEMLGERMNRFNANVWLVNTGWTGGGYGTGHRIALSNTRAMISAALNGQLNEVEYRKHEVFGLQMPVECPNVPPALLHPKNTWQDKEAYNRKANNLAQSFIENFKRFEDQASEEIKASAPVVKIAS